MSSKQLPLVSIVPVGESYERFKIVNTAHEFWDGKQFTKEGQPSLYANINEASTDIKVFLKQQFGESGGTTYFVAPVFIEVTLGSEGQLDVQEIIDYLHRVCTLETKCHEGYGPRGSLVMPTIAWHRMEQLKNEPTA